MPLGKSLLHPLEMVDLDVVSEIALVQHGHRENVEKVSRHIDKGGSHELLRCFLINAECRHHVCNSTPPHLCDDEIIEIPEQPAKGKQDGTRRAAGNTAQKHQRTIEHVRTSFSYCTASPASF